MAQPCYLCHHKDRLKADKLIIQGKTNREVAEKMGCSISAVHRHRSHVAEAISKGFAKREEVIEDELVNLTKGLLEKADLVYQKSLEYLKDDEGKELRLVHPDYLRSIGNAIGDQRQLIETLGRLMGKLKGPEVQINQVNLVNVAPIIYQVLEHHPSALKEVQEALLARPG